MAMATAKRSTVHTSTTAHARSSPREYPRAMLIASAPETARSDDADGSILRQLTFEVSFGGSAVRRGAAVNGEAPALSFLRAPKSSRTGTSVAGQNPRAIIVMPSQATGPSAKTPPITNERPVKASTLSFVRVDR